ncbi:hypothetical protein PybrP1_006571 [[Pythium] brassicae (nom. inval.)]|nr:hypothetical protein PybrP1_006571 [[Pythium] brassicae (nom. inval.)]
MSYDYYGGQGGGGNHGQYAGYYDYRGTWWPGYPSYDGPRSYHPAASSRNESHGRWTYARSGQGGNFHGGAFDGRAVNYNAQPRGYGGGERDGYFSGRADRGGHFDGDGGRGGNYGGGGERSGRYGGGDGRGGGYSDRAERGGHYGGGARAHYGGGGGRGGERGGANATSSGVGAVPGNGYEAVGAPIVDPHDEEEWCGRLPPRDVAVDCMELQQTFDICRRPNFAVHARTIAVTVNCFALTLDPRVEEIYKYHVHVERTPLEHDNEGRARGEQQASARPLRKSLVRRVISAAFCQYDAEFDGHRVSHDGMGAAYSAVRLPWDNKVLAGVNPNLLGAATATGARRERGFMVTLKFVEMINVRELFDHFTRPKVNPLPALQALDVAARHLAAQGLIPVGRNFFSMRKTQPLRGGKELSWGYHQSIRLGQQKLLLNIDQAATVFYAPGPLLELVIVALNVRDARSVGPLSERDARNLSRALRKIEVTTTHRSDRKKPIFGVSSQPASATLFEADGATTSVAEYFRRRYNITLQYANLPAVNLGGRNRPTWLPVEVCEVAPGQQCQNINDLDTAEIIRQTSQRPEVRAKNILEHAHSAGFENDPFVKAFGMTVDMRMETVEAKVLETPEVQYANVLERPRMGMWSLKDRTFVDGAVLRNWGVVVHANVSESDVQRFVRTLCNIAQLRGINIENRQPPITHQDHHRGAQVEDLMLTCVRGLEQQRSLGPPQLVVVIMRGRSVLYSDIKRTSDTLLGVPSQCLLASNVVKCQTQYCANVCMKMNVKLGGKNLILRDDLPLVSTTPAIVIGASISHPRSGMGSRPSIASVVASLDRYSAKYVSRVAAQRASNDIAQLPHLLYDLFLAFYQATSRKPEHIVYYRDGVSSSEQHDILQTEMKALRQACLMVSASFKPPVTFIVVNTRHHMRAFASHSSDEDRSGNIQPGTVIDSGVVDPHRFDFYLYGHSGLQGTSCPAHYSVLYDENGMSAEDVHRLSYSLCYTFARCTRSVSVVPPVYYAQLAATRARCFLNEASDGASTAGPSRSSYEFLDVHKNIQDSMFFM